MYYLFIFEQWKCTQNGEKSQFLRVIIQKYKKEMLTDLNTCGDKF